MIIGYARVSTQSQNTDRQTDELKNARCERIFIDRISGARGDRPELSRMFDCLREGDMVIVTELSRFGRSTKDLITLMERLGGLSVQFRSLKEPFIDTSTLREL